MIRKTYIGFWVIIHAFFIVACTAQFSLTNDNLTGLWIGRYNPFLDINTGEPTNTSDNIQQLEFKESQTFEYQFNEDQSCSTDYIIEGNYTILDEKIDLTITRITISKDTIGEVSIPLFDNVLCVYHDPELMWIGGHVETLDESEFHRYSLEIDEVNEDFLLLNYKIKGLPDKPDTLFKE